MEHEFFVDIFDEENLREYAKRLEVFPLGKKVPIEKQPIHLIRKEIKYMLKNGYKVIRGRRNGPYYPDELRTLGEIAIEKYGLPRVIGEELLRECGIRFNISEPILLGYVYLQDENLYHENIEKWIKYKLEGKKLFEKYANNISPDEKLIRYLSPEIILKISLENMEEDISKINVEEMPEYITPEYIIDFEGTLGEKIKLVYCYLEQNKQLDEAIRRKLISNIICLLSIKKASRAMKEKNKVEESIKILDHENKKMEKEIKRNEIRLIKVREKQKSLQDELADQKVQTKKLENESIGAKEEIKNYQESYQEIVKKKEWLERDIAKNQKMINGIAKIFNCSLDKIMDKVLYLNDRKLFLESMLPDPEQYVVIANKQWLKTVPDIIAKENFFDVSVCFNEKWCENHQGEMAFLHRESFGIYMDYLEAQKLLCNNMNVIEINAQDQNDWLREIIRKGVV